MTGLAIRAATRADATSLLTLVDALADYEQLARPNAEARERLIRDAFGSPPRFSVLIAETAGAPVGYALFFEAYSSFLARPTLYLEDLFVLPTSRGESVGFRLFRAVADEAVRRGAARLEWAVLRWNRLAIDFYDRIGGTPMDDWLHYRLEGDGLAAAPGEA